MNTVTRSPFTVSVTRALRFLAGSALAAATALTAWAQPAISAPGTAFAAAQPGRTFMTVGGVWNGTAEVTNTTGDTFSVTYTNTGDATAFDFTPLLTLPANFTYVAGTAQVVTAPATPGLTVSAVQVGNQLNFTFSPAGYDLPAGTAITLGYGLTTTTAIGDGTYQLTHNRTYALTDGGPQEPAGLNALQNILVQAGTTTLNITPKQQVRAVGETAEFTVTITNTGLGGLFDIVLDESAINPGNNLQLLSIVQTSPVLAAVVNGAGDVLTLPYLAPGESFAATVEAEVTACGTIINIAATDDRTGDTAATDQAPVQLNLQQPLVSYAAPAIALDYNNPAPVSLTINNTGAGDARAFTLHTTLPARPVTITNIGAGWSYNAGTGVFTYTANAGTIANAGSATLTFDIEATDICADSGAGSVSYEARYTNGCGDAYVIPQTTGSIIAAADTPNVNLTKTVSDNRIAIIESGTYTLTLSASNLANIATDPLVVTDTLPAGVTYAAHTASSGAVNVVGQVVTWTVSKAALAADQTLEIDFTVDNEPCLAGTILDNTASVSATSSQGCAIGDTANAGFLVSNNPGLASSQFFNVTPDAPDGIFETGNASADAVRDDGEGEFVPFEANYEFGAMYPGTWVGTTYEDDFGGITQQTLVPGTLTYRFNGGAPVAVPPASVTTLAAGFRINLSFLGVAVAGTGLQINYQTTVPDTALTGTTRGVLQRTHLIVAGIDPGDVPGGICDETTQFRFTQGAYYTVGRAAATINLGMASQLEVCREETLTITIGNANAEDAHNVLVTLLNASSEFIYPAAQVPVYGGAFNAGNITYTANAGVNPTFHYTGDPLAASGTIQVRVIRRATSPVNTTGFSARVDYDSSQTDAAGSRVYSSTANYAPSVVRKANLALTVTPGSITVAGQTASYVIYVTNTDAGTAYEARATATLPAGITPNAGLMNAANSGPDVFVAGQDLLFDLGDIPSGTTVTRTIIGDVGIIPGCAINITTEKVQASWGCEGDTFFTTERTHPAFFFPTGKMQVVHDSTQSFASICSEGRVVIIVRNTGATSIENVVVDEMLPLAEGISLKPGSVQYRLNGGGLVAGADPVIVGNTHTWTSAQIPALAQLAPVGATIDGNDIYEVRIEFDLNQTETLAGNSPTLLASAEAAVACGATVTSPGQAFDITVFQPDVALVKTGRNTSAGEVAYAGTVYGGAGDTVEWRIVLTNTGNLAAENVRLSDALSGSAGVAVINGPGLAVNTPYAANTVLAIPDLASGSGTATYVITETLGANCVTASPQARVSWGCTVPGAGVHNSVDEPGAPVDTAGIVMIPAIAGGADIAQTITYLNGGRARIDVAITNTGGNAHDIVVTDTFPNAGMVLDTTVAPAFNRVATHYPSLTSVITGVSTDNTNTLAPEFTFTNGGSPEPMLRFGDRVTLTYYVRPVVFDTTTATTFPELAAAEANPALDPNPPATGNNTIRVDYESSCGGASFDTDAASINLRTPDLDVTASSPGNSLLTGTANANYTFTITNNGEAGSVANFITADFPDLGAGWTVNSITLTTPGTGGTGGTIPVDGATPFTTVQFGTLSSGQTALITVNAAYSGTPGPLTLKLRVRGEARGQDGVTAYGDYSLDQRAQRIVGVTLAKTLQSTSESTTAGANVMVGEEATYLLRADFFGVEDDITALTIRDTPADSSGGGLAHTNLAYVSHAFTVNDELALTASAPAPVTVPANLAASRVNFTAATVIAADINAGTNTFETELTVRVLNVAGNTHNKVLRNNLGVEFTYLGQKFRSNNGDDGFSGGTSTGDLHKQTDLTVRRPTATIVKEVRNVTTDTEFGSTAEGQAGDTLEYRIVVTNPNVANAAPLFSISVEDEVPAKLILLGSAAGVDAPGADTIAPAGVDVFTTGIVGGDGVDITFNSANTAINNPGSDLDQLDPGESITLLYRVTLAEAVNPSETLVNSATVTGYTLPAPSGSQTAPLGAQDTATGSDAIAAGPATAAVNIIAINQDKVITDYSALPDDDDRVTIGEQIRYRVTLNLPLGTAPDLSVTDTLPAGLALIGTPVIDIGDDIAADNEPPLFAQTNGGQTLTWTFGETLASGADRSITIDYVAQVRNIAGNTAGTVLTNNAAYNFTGLPGDVINLTQRSVTVAAPAITVTHGVRNATRNSGGPYVPSIAALDAIAPDAGDLLEYQISITNASGANIASGYDFNITDTMPAGVTYVDGWAGFDALSGVTPPAFATFEPDIDGQLLTWGRGKAAPVNIDIAPGGTLVFHYRVRVIDAGQPLQNYTNAVTVDWTSLDGAPGPNLGDPVLAPGNALGERNGAGTAPNTYLAERDAPVVARNATDLVKTKAGDTLPRDNADVLDAPADGFRIGDLVTYTLTLPVQEGTLDAFTIADTLPAGLAFHDTVSITPATGADGFTYTTPVAGATAPELGDTGALAWDFGTLVNTGDNDTDNDELILVYRARVLDPAGLAVTPVNQTQDNTATIAFTLADTSTHTSDASIVGLTVRQPRLTLAKAIISPAVDALGNHVRRPTDTASYRITIANTGTAPAYNIALTDTLPEGLRDTAPVLTAATRNGVDVLATQTAPTWDNGTGAYVWNLADTELLLPGEELVLTYTVTVDDDDTLRGATLTNSAEIDAFYSLPSGDAEAVSRRTYAAVGPETADLVIGLRIDGFVYHDIDLSDARDGAEDWSGLKPTVFANLIADNGGDPIVFRTVTVPAGTGAFAFDYLPPGDFDIILTDSAGNLVAQRPANWLNQNPANGLIDVTINQGTGDLVDQNLGLDQGVYSPVLAPTITKTATGETIPAAGPQTAFRIGDLVTYTVDIFPHEGTNTTFLVTDELPAGLAFHDTVSIAQVAGPARYTYVTPAGGNAPAAAAEGTITWNFGTFTNAIADPANNTLRITYRARVINTGTDPLAVPAASPATTTDGPLTNSAEVGYGNTAVSVDPLAAGPATDDITVEQPRLTIAKALTTPALNRLPPEATGTFTVTVTNDGTAPAYNIRVTDTLPVGLRDTAPTLTAATLNGVDVLAGLTPVWTGAAGTYVFNLSNTQILLPGQELVLAYQFTVDEDATRAATLTNSAVVNRYFSKPSNDSTQRRQYAATDPATADIIVGLRIAGTVYEDDDLNDALTPGEDWTGATKPTVYVNLIAGGVVVESETIAPGTGAFEFTNLPEDDYTLIVATTPTALVSDRPANWLYRAPADGTYDLADTDDDLVRNFGFWQDTLETAGITKTQTGGTLPLSAPADGYRIGDLVTYTLDLAPQEGELTNLVVTDVLPAGLAFVETVSIAQPAGAPRYTYVTPAGANAPEADDTGTLTWTFGDFENALNGPADNILRLTYTARILDTGGIAVPAASPATTSATRVNSATLAYDNEDDDPISAGPATATLDVEQPRLIIAKTRLAPVADNIVMPAGTAQFRLTVTNNGTGPAYNVTLTDTLPAGLRDATPVLDNATLNGGAFTPDSVDYVAGTGVWTIALSDAQILLPAGETIVLDYTVTVDADATKGAVLTNSALVASYASKASADADERRVYAPTAPSTQDLIVGMQIDGSVYHQLIPNGMKDVGDEDWTSGTPVVVNLVTNNAINYGSFSLGANQVLRSIAVPVGDGEFTFTNVPAGNYRIIVTDTAVNTTPAVPATWTFDTPATGSITPVAASNADIADQHLGLYQGRVISGRVYNDAAPFGSREAETWAGGVEVVVNLVNTYGVPLVHESITVPAGVGTYEFTDVPPGSYQVIVAPAGQAAATTAAAPANWVFVEPDTGTIGTFLLTTSDVTGQEFGLTLGRTVSGFVFNDTNPNGSKDGFEDWLTGTPVVVNLVRASDNTVFGSANVAIGAGDYEFTNVPPGDFRIIVTNGAAQTTAVAPPSWLFRNPPSGSQNITVAGADLEDRNFALFRGRTLAGRVFRDNGAGGGAANNGTQTGGEPGIGNVTVRLLSAGLTILDTAQTNGSGDFILRIPADTADGATLIVEEINPPVHRSTGADVGDSGGTYNIVTDRLTFTYADADVTGVRFGDVPASALLTDGAQTILPGATALYRHTFRAGTAGTVTFTTNSTATPSLPWTQVLVRDLNCNGAIDGGEPIIEGVALTVEADEEICLILKDNSPPNTGFGARHATVITAVLDYANSALDETMSREDVTTIGPTSSSGLQLVKEVDKTTAAPGEVITYTVTYTNSGAEDLTDLFIDDRTPAYTVLAAPSTYTLPLPDGLTVGTVTEPAVNAAGSIRWTFGGVLTPGASGSVIFQVKVEE